MNSEILLDKLGYLESPNFFHAEDAASFHQAVDFSHIFRRARERCSLQGVYSLRQTGQEGRDVVVPVVYVCEARDHEHAERIHRRVWNQNVVPFLIITSPKDIRLYSGFRYELHKRDSHRTEAGILKVVEDIHQALEALDAFRAPRIDDGSLWDDWGAYVTPETRVDWRLLNSLEDLDMWLQRNGIADSEVSHALIGKYVYLSYLRQRDILSNRRLADWDLDENHIFGRQARLSAFLKVVERLDDWLNGTVFPIETSDPSRLAQEHVRQVAGTFSGDDPATGQLALDFDLYDFSFIPIEALSVIYEQFMHAPKSDGSPGSGRSQGAYYTPLPLVNFMLEELDSLHPFQKGMRVLDPACGSGAFLVQTYRRVIELDEEFKSGRPMRPEKLRALLVEHIFGIDRDLGACRVAELSLILTLLDYVHPPDLTRAPRLFQLPELFGSNIFQGDFFDPTAHWRERLKKMEFDWIVGNPPWIELSSNNVSQENIHVWRWMKTKEHKKDFPVSGNQVAEAFAWEVTEHLKTNGWAALLLPAMTLFKDEAKDYRSRFFSTLQVRAVANFSNMAYILFPGHRWHVAGSSPKMRSERPAAAFFYSRQRSGHATISVFSPLVAEQVANRPTRPGCRKDTWNIVIDASQIRTLDVSSASDGSALQWKTAMWGSHLDLRFIHTLKKFPSLETFRKNLGLLFSAGIELRRKDSHDQTEFVPELVGKFELKTSKLRRQRRLFEFPKHSLHTISSERAYLRVRGGRAGIAVSKPPHVVVDKLRRFAVYSDDFILVPPRQIGISGTAAQSDLLKALSLYLISDFAKYFEFFVSPEWGISTSISTLDTLRKLPVPFSEMSASEIATWAALRDRIVVASGDESVFTGSRRKETSIDDLIRELNQMVVDALGLQEFEQALIRDLVHVRMELVKGKTSKYAMAIPTEDELRQYASVVVKELDAFIADQPELSHSVFIIKERGSAIVAVSLHQNELPDRKIRVVNADEDTTRKLASIYKKIHKRYSQWVYFYRNLRLYDGRTVFIFKPLQRLHWTQSQAALDAGSIIGETLR